MGVCCGCCAVLSLVRLVSCLWLSLCDLMWVLATCFLVLSQILARDSSRRDLSGSFVAAPKPGGLDRARKFLVCPVLFAVMC